MLPYIDNVCVSVYLCLINITVDNNVLVECEIKRYWMKNRNLQYCKERPSDINTYKHPNGLTKNTEVL